LTAARQVRARGHHISYRIAGDGPAILLLCGLSQWCDQWFTEGYVDALRDHYTVITVDRLGHGSSDKPHDPAQYHERDIVADLIAVLDAASIERVVAWGFSLGAKNAASLAALAPDRVTALVYGSSAALTDPPDEIIERSKDLVDLLRAEDGLRVFWQFVGFTDDDLVRDGLARNDAEALACALEGSFTWFATAADITAPSLWYRGGAEADFTEAGRAHAAANGVELHVVPDANHTAAFHRSAEVLALVRPFLDRVSIERSP
jgi:pimeloyl-ACP methyl ester carboxylesterase